MFSLREGCRVWYGSRHSLCHRHLTGVLPSRQCHYRLPAGTALAEGERCDGLAPYRLISLDGAGTSPVNLTGISLCTLWRPSCGDSPEHHFYPAKTSQPVNTQAGFIRALPHFSCIREVLSMGPLRRSMAIH